MDNLQKLNAWILNQVDSKKIKITRFKAIERLLPKSFDFQASTVINGHEVVGRSAGFDKDLALKKAVSELVERVCCIEHDIESNGVACHTSKVEAECCARKELIERDAILCHHLTETPLTIIDPFDADIDFTALNTKLEGEGVKLEFLRANSSSSEFTVICCRAIGHKKFHCIYGFGCDQRLSNAVHGALFECLINVSAYLTGVYPITWSDPRDLKIPRGVDHQKYHFYSKVDALAPCSHFSPSSSFLDDLTFQTKSLEIPSDLTEGPFHVVRAISNDLQNIFYGRLVESLVNTRRLYQFSGQKINFDSLNSEPHPIG